jgi:hypothetical protein
MPQTDVYEYVAVATISHGNVIAYQPGDPVPGDNVERLGYEVGVQVVLRKDYKPDHAEAEPHSGPSVRGELPSDLRGGPESDQDKSAGKADASVPTRSGKAATAK